MHLLAMGFKKSGYEFWLMTTEKFSVKTVLALFEITGSSQDIQERTQALAKMLQNVYSGSSSALANIKELKELSMSGDLVRFNALVEACDIHQIAYGLTGQSLASNNPSHGTQALGTVQAQMFQEDARGIALGLQQVIQKAINWTTELNFGPEVILPIFEFDMEQRASFDQIMTAIDHEIPVSKQEMYSYPKAKRMLPFALRRGKALGCLILIDPPYGITNCPWDIAPDLNAM